MENKIQEVIVIDDDGGDNKNIKKSKIMKNKFKKKIEKTSKRSVILKSGPESTENLIITQKVKLRKKNIEYTVNLTQFDQTKRHRSRQRHKQESRDRDSKKHKRTSDRTSCGSSIRYRPSLLTSLKERPTPICLRKRCAYESIEQQSLRSDSNKKKSFCCDSNNGNNSDLTYEDITSDSFLSSDEEQLDTLIKRAKQRESERRFKKNMPKSLMTPKKMKLQKQIPSNVEKPVLKSESLSSVSSVTLPSSEDKSHMSSPIYLMISPIHVKLPDTQSAIISDTESSINDNIEESVSYKDILSEKIVSYSEMDLCVSHCGLAYSPSYSPDNFFEGKDESESFCTVDQEKEINDCQIKREMDVNFNIPSDNNCTVNCKINAGVNLTGDKKSDLNLKGIVYDNDSEALHVLSKSIVVYSEPVTNVIEDKHTTDIETDTPNKIIENAMQLLKYFPSVKSENHDELIPYSPSMSPTNLLIEKYEDLISYIPISPLKKEPKVNNDKYILKSENTGNYLSDISDIEYIWDTVKMEKEENNNYNF